MIDTNNIISSIGAGSGIDTKNLVQQLTELEGAAKQQKINSAREKTEAQISDFGLLKSSLSKLQSSLKALSDPEGLFSKTASFTETNAIVPEKLGTNVETGTYSLTVLDTAQAQSLASAVSFSDLSSPVGKGEITFTLGSWDTDEAGNNSFTADSTKQQHTITIDESNNSLKGLRDAINKADFGVQASIVNDGSGYKLLLTAPSGASNELQIEVNEVDGGDNLDGEGLSRFAFSEDSQQMISSQEGRDAVLKINGLTVNRSSNHIDDLVEGFSFSVVKADPDGVVNVTITDDKAYAEEKIREFVESYNTFLEEIKPAFEYGLERESESEEEPPPTGSLASDTLAKSVLSQLRTAISNEVLGLSGDGYTAMTNLGIRTERDGTLIIEEKEFRKAIDENFELVQSLFAAGTSSSSPDITVSSSHASAVSGSYEVEITTPPKKGGLLTDAGGVPLDTTGKDYSFNVTVDSITSGSLSLPEDAVYTSHSAMAEDLQAIINADSKLQAAGKTVTVNYNSETQSFEFLSGSYGTSSKVSFSSESEEFATDFGLDNAQVIEGRNVEGKIDGVEAEGIGNGLLPPRGSRAYGLTFTVTEDATSGTVNFTKGFAGELSGMIDRFQRTEGIIGARVITLEERLETLDEDQKKLDVRLSAFQERMMQQFIAMENILNGLNSSGGFLESLMDTLPFTAKRD